jgi:hypothetical protein
MSYKRISPMPVNEGGTGNTTLTANTVLVGNGTSAISQVTAGTTGQVLIGATSSNPTFAALGTNSGLTSNGVLLGANNGAITATAAGTTGQVLTGVTGSAPTFQSPAGGITTAAGDSGTATGSTVTWNANTNSGSTVKFTASSSTVSLNVTDANNNTIIGSGAGGSAIYDSNSTAVGYNALKSTNSSSSGSNTAFGSQVLQACTTGGSNCAVGNANLITLTTGNYNCAIGSAAGFNYTGAESNNVLIQNLGTVGESNALRISSSGTGNRQVSTAYIGGITGIVVSGAPVLVSSGDQLGVAASSKRFKNDIQDMATASTDILKLRPVTFVWNKSSSPGLKNAPDERQFGLIAEEVAEVMPTLVNYDKDNKPFTVKYDDLPAMLLNELKKALNRIDALEATLKTK